MRTFLISIAMTALTASAAIPVVEWQSLGNTTGADGKPTYTQRFTITGAKGVDAICFNQFARQMSTTDPADTISEIIPGYYRLKSPRLTLTGSAVIDVVTSGTLRHVSYRPDGFHAVTTDGFVAPVKTVINPISRHPAQWSLPDSDLNPPADSIFRQNQRLAAGRRPAATDIVPSLKSVTPANGRFAWGAAPIERPIADPRPEFYRIDLSGDTAIIQYASPRALIAAHTTLALLAERDPDGLPACIIEDYPDYSYRGLMIDIARNFTGLPGLQKIAQLMARYKLNKLHLHLTDDEAWRIEIKPLPELTSYGSRRGYTLDESTHLAQLFRGNGNPDTDSGSANGYLSRDEFVGFLRYCSTLGIDVIPEIESPGHARAAIKAMERRRVTTGDSSTALRESDDSSAYTSAQAFHDNVMNPALESTYRFLGIVYDEIAAMYREAGVELTAIHIGGDEVPRGAWNGSKAVAKMMADNGFDSDKAVQAAFVGRIGSMLAERGLAMNGWQEIATGHDDSYNRAIAPMTGGVNFWTSARDSLAATAAATGYPVIISNVEHFYLDQAYNNHPDEPGLTWGGTVDEMATLNGYASRMCPASGQAAGRVIGVSGQLFAETVTGFNSVLSHLLPKMLGLAERAWNASPTYSEPDFNRLIGESELKALELRRLRYHLRQPGINVNADGAIEMNSPYQGYEIRYTLDGSDPTAASTLYTKPFNPGGATEIRARLLSGGNSSASTIRYLSK